MNKRINDSDQLVLRALICLNRFTQLTFLNEITEAFLTEQQHLIAEKTVCTERSMNGRFTASGAEYIPTGIYVIGIDGWNQLYS